MIMIHDLYQIMAPHFCAGFVMKEDVVVNAAPIIRYMMGWSYRKVQAYCQKKNWQLTAIKYR